MRHRYLLERWRPHIDQLNQQWRTQHTLQQSTELVHQEVHDMECALAVGMGLRTAQGYVYPEPHPHPSIPLAPDDTSYQYAPVNVMMHRQDVVTMTHMKELLRTFAVCGAMEYVSDGERMFLQLAIPHGAEVETLGFLRTAFPLSRFHYDAPDLVQDAVQRMDGICLRDYCFSGYTVYPLNAEFEIPPLEQLCSILDSPWGRGCRFGLQILFSPCRTDWYQYYLDLSRWVTLPSTKVLSPHLPIETEILAKCTPEGLYATTVRTFAETPHLLEVLEHNFIRSFNSVRQRLVAHQRPVAVDELIGRRTRQEGILLNGDELACVASLPSPAVTSPALGRIRVPSTHVPPDFLETS